MDNNNQTQALGSHLIQSIEHLDKFLEGLKGGDALKFNSEKEKAEFEKQKAEQGIDKSILDAQAKIQEARDMFRNMGRK